MLQNLIRIIAEGQVHSQMEVARRLGVSEGLVEQMLEDLNRMGYVKRLDEEYGEKCAACPMARTCAPGDRGQVWMVTEKAQATSNS